jgi:transcriptional regulator with XRE-family HTH domain
LSVADRIYEARVKRLSMTQRELSDALESRNGRKPDTVSISRWERGVAEPSLWYLRQIAELAEVPVSWFFDEVAA